MEGNTFMSSHGPKVQRVEEMVGLNLGPYDYVGVTYPADTTEIYTFRRGGSTGPVVAIVTVVYTDDTKTVLSSVTKLPTIT